MVRMAGSRLRWHGSGAGSSHGSSSVVVAAVPAHALGEEAAVDLVGAARVDAAEHGALEARAAGGGDRDRGGHL